MATPNILFLHVHDLGRFLNCYGVDTVQTPHLDALAASGVRFGRSFCPAPGCSPSRAAMFTGRYPHANGVMGLAHGTFAFDLHADERHLASYLAAAGYTTAAIGVVHETSRAPTALGYQTYAPRHRAAAVADEALAFLRAHHDDDAPFFLCAGAVEPHRFSNGNVPGAPYPFIADDIEADDSLGVSVPGYLRDTPGTRAELAELQGCVRHLDQEMGRILDGLDAVGLRENTLVIFTTDHGIAMPRAKCNVYDPGIETALLLRLPNRAGWHGGRVEQPMINNIDLVPTLLDLLGLPCPDAVQGQSFAPLLDGADYAARDALFAELTYHQHYDPRRAVRTDTHKLIANFSTALSFMDASQSWRPRAEPHPDCSTSAFHPYLELYDLTTDPWELANLASAPEHADIVDDLRARLLAWMESTADPLLAGAIPAPQHAATMALLRA
jgi:arylsulfatase A-like enzyme